MIYASACQCNGGLERLPPTAEVATKSSQGLLHTRNVLTLTPLELGCVVESLCLSGALGPWPSNFSKFLSRGLFFFPTAVARFLEHFPPPPRNWVCEPGPYWRTIGSTAGAKKPRKHEDLTFSTRGGYQKA